MPASSSSSPLRLLPVAVLLLGSGPCKTPGTDCDKDDLDGDGVPCAEDCDDNDPLRFPGAAEVCDGLDNNCDGAIDEGVTITLYTDQDGDGWGTGPFESCEEADLESSASRGGDCDDTQAAIHPEAAEACDGVDNDCDGLVDAADPGAPVQTCYIDGDGDGHGGTEVRVCGETCGEGQVRSGGDCDDTTASVHPGAPDREGDGVDGDCDGVDCTTGTWGSMTFGLCSHSGTVPEAQAVCTQFGGSLLSIRNGAEQAYVVSLMQETGQQLVITGLSDSATEGAFVWGDGSALGYTNWGEGEPNNNYESKETEGEDCMAIQASYGYGWNDVPCGFAFGGVTAGCQRDRTETPFQRLTGTRTFLFGTAPKGSGYDPSTDAACRLVWALEGVPAAQPCEGCIFSFDVTLTLVDDSEANSVPACTSRSQDTTTTLTYFYNSPDDQYFSYYDGDAKNDPLLGYECAIDVGSGSFGLIYDYSENKDGVLYSYYYAGEGTVE